MSENEFILEVRGISKQFPGVNALENVNLCLKKGEVHAVMGENGAGKSTLMKIVMGLYRADEGEIYLNGNKVEIDNPSTALKLGISMIHQELSPIPEMTIAENIFLGREEVYKSTPFVKRKDLDNRTTELLKKFKMELNPKTKMSRLSVAQIQMIEIIKAVSYNSSVIIMDEPTSALSDDEVKKLFSTIRDLRKDGVGIIYISHRMEELFEIADSVTVLRDGKYIGTDSMENMTKERLISMMVGRELSNIFPKKDVSIGEVVFEVKHLTSKGVFEDINFQVRRGEILGISGLVGAGRSEIVRAIFGIDRFDSGELVLEGREIKVKGPYDAINNGIAMVSEDRKEIGLILCRSIKENIALPNIGNFCKGIFIKLNNEKKECQKAANDLSIRMRSINQIVENLSGGNQQKVVIAKWLLSNPKVLILDEPTRGIDVGAKAEIHRMMSDLAEQGLGIIMISSELPEIMGMSDRILVIGDGKINGEFVRGSVTQEDILKCALGGKDVA